MLATMCSAGRPGGICQPGCTLVPDQQILALGIIVAQLVRLGLKARLDEACDGVMPAHGAWVGLGWVGLGGIASPFRQSINKKPSRANCVPAEQRSEPSAK